MSCFKYDEIYEITSVFKDFFNFFKKIFFLGGGGGCIYYIVCIREYCRSKVGERKGDRSESQDTNSESHESAELSLNALHIRLSPPTVVVVFCYQQLFLFFFTHNTI